MLPNHDRGLYLWIGKRIYGVKRLWGRLGSSRRGLCARRLRLKKYGHNTLGRSPAIHKHMLMRRRPLGFMDRKR